ncbi:hypothetical protein M7I_3955 [Glarea lozoyensis 74030]|uniref:Uncharacterized protein n=1 Tax=Glarea lozoyensis (strain ATCC 74030 / MF5533) TaxID=1104152 RepID=H0EMV7_GLAL7|nr:hypothetical protein M7I_3955 [Glarea lozoyensis 74030]
MALGSLERDNKTVSWNDTFINELKTGLVACRSLLKRDICVPSHGPFFGERGRGDPWTGPEPNV